MDNGFRFFSATGPSHLGRYLRPISAPRGVLLFLTNNADVLKIVAFVAPVLYIALYVNSQRAVAVSALNGQRAALKRTEELLVRERLAREQAQTETRLATARETVASEQNRLQQSAASLYDAVEKVLPAYDLLRATGNSFMDAQTLLSNSLDLLPERA